jgi:hypothetical protein
LSNLANLEDFVNTDKLFMTIQDFILFIQDRNKSYDVRDESSILDISSGFLHLAGDLLVPESINKSCLVDAKVLQQVDKKFIPVVGDGTLAVIDQVYLLLFVLDLFFPS